MFAKAEQSAEELVNHTQQNVRIYPITEGIQSSKTKIVYQRCFNHFLNKIKIHDLQVLLDFSPKVIKQMIVDYVLYLRDERKLSRTSIKVHLAAILHFFQINNDDFMLTLRNFRIHLPSDESIKEDRPYTTEEIGRVLEECDVRSKVMILLMASTGMRMGALHSLQICDLTKIEFQNSILYKVQVYARTRDKYSGFCTLECAKAIDEYIDYRKRFGEEITDKSPLIREQFNLDDKVRIAYPRFVSEKGIEHIIDNVLKKSGIRKPGIVHLSHGYRKHFFSVCEKSGMKSINVKMLLGHDIGVSGHYYRPAESDLLQDFMDHACDALTINQNQRLKARVQQLEGQQTQEIAKLRE
ncbi:MAG: tyrosine-type recombinase/integrase, partial [Nitrososphaeraceae archaeon]